MDLLHEYADFSWRLIIVVNKNDTFFVTTKCSFSSLYIYNGQEEEKKGLVNPTVGKIINYQKIVNTDFFFFHSRNFLPGHIGQASVAQWGTLGGGQFPAWLPIYEGTAN